MSKEFDEKTKELIDLAEASEDEKLEAGEKKDEKVEELREASEVAPKKKGKGGKIALVIVGVILALLLAAGGTGFGLLSCATKDELPAAPSTEDVDIKEFTVGAVTEVVTDNTITVNNDVANALFGIVKDKLNASDGAVRFDDLFCELADGKGTLYTRVYIGTLNVSGTELKLDKTFPVQADFTVDFDEDKNIVIDLGEVRCGKVKIPQAVIDAVFASVEVPEEMTLDEDGIIRYDTSDIDAKIDEAVSNAITSKMDGVLGNWFADIATDIIDVELTGASIDGDSVVINGKII